MIQYDLMRKCETLMDLYLFMKDDADRFENPRVLFAAASLFLTARVKYDSEEVCRCLALLRNRHGIFSRFRGTETFITACKMSLAQDPGAYLDTLEDLSERLNVGILYSGRTVLTAMILEDNLDGRDPEYLINKTKDIYHNMKTRHMFLTTGEDLPMAALMASSEKDPQTIFDDAERAYQVFKRDLKAEVDAIQLLSHIVSLYYGDIEEMCQKIIDLADILHREKHTLGSGVRLGILAPMADLPFSAYELSRDIIDASDFLKEFKEFRGLFGLGERDRNVFAAVCATSVNYDAESAQRSALISTSVQLAIIQQIMMAAAVAAAA